MFKAFFLFGSLSMSIGLVFAFGWPVLVAFAVLALGTVVLSVGGPDHAAPGDGYTGMGGTTFMAGL